MNEKYRVMNQNVQICYTISNKMIELKGKHDSYDSDRYSRQKLFLQTSIQTNSFIH